MATLALMILLPSLSRAQGGADPAWTTFNTQLVSSNVRVVLVAQDDSVWFGTRGGLSHFNGFWQTYTEVDGLPGGAVTALAQAPDGTIWVGSEAGLARAAPPAPGQRWHWTDGGERAPAGPIYALWVAKSGEIWVGTDQGVGILSDTGWRPISLKGKADASPRIQAIAADPKGGLWLGGEGLFFYDAEAAEARPITISTESTIQTILVTQVGERWPHVVWVGTQTDGLWSNAGTGWLHFWRPNGTPPTESIVANDVLALAQEADGTLWIGTNGGGISLFNPDGLNPRWSNSYWHNLTAVDGLSANAVAAIDIDRDGVVWLGTIGGVTRFDGRTWQTLVSSTGVMDGEVSTAFQDSTGAIWFGTDGKGLIRFDGERVEVLTAINSGLPEDFVRTLTEDSNGYLWVGTARQGLLRAPLIGVENLASVDADQWQQFNEAQLGSNVLRASAAADDGSLWFGTLAGLTHYIPASRVNSVSGGEWEVFGTADGLASEQIEQNALIVDNQDRVWVGTPAGLSRYDPKQDAWRTYTTADGLTNEGVLSIATALPCTSACDIWVGTADGSVSRYDPESDRFILFDSKSAPVFGLLATPDQNLWIGTAGGLRRHDLTAGLSWDYDQSDGLVTNEVRALVAGERGAIWVGTSAGISRYRPYSRRPLVKILTVNGHTPIDGHVEVQEGEPVAINFTGGDMLTPPDQLGFRIRRADLDDGWQDTAGQQAILRDLKPGSYTFQVQSWNSALNLSQPAAVVLDVVSMTVLPLLGPVPTATAVPIVGLTVIAIGGVTASGMHMVRSRERRRRALKRRYNPYVSGEPVVSRDMFFGRDQVLEQILNTLHENSIMIHGERRIGKTSLLHQLGAHLRQVKDPDYCFIPVYVDLEGTSQDRLFHTLMEEIVQELPDYLSELPTLQFNTLNDEAYGDREFSRDLSAILRALKATTDKQIRMILLLDEMDVMNDFDSVVQQQLRRIFMRTFAGNLGAVVAGIAISKEWDRVESPWYNLFNEIELGPLDRESARRLIMDPVKGIYTFAPEAVEFIIEESQGRPFYIQQHCLEAVNNMLAAGRTQVLLEDVEKALDIITSARTSQGTGLSVSEDT